MNWLAEKTGGDGPPVRNFAGSLVSFWARAAVRCRPHGGRTCCSWRRSRTCGNRRRRRPPRSRCGRSDRTRRGSRCEGGSLSNGWPRCRRRPVHLWSCRYRRWAVHRRRPHNGRRSAYRRPSRRTALHDAPILGGSAGDGRAFSRAPVCRTRWLIALTSAGSLLGAALTRRYLSGRPRRCIRRRDVAAALLGPATCCGLALFALPLLR